MAKFTVLASLLAAFLVVSAVSARTTITTTVIEDDAQNPQQGRCEEQIRKQDNLDMCHVFLREKIQGRGGSSSYYDNLVMVTGQENPQQGDTDLKQGCCRQLENVSEDCRCEGLAMMMERHQHKGQEMQQMRSTAENLPSMCGIGPQKCQIRTAMY